MKNFKKFLSVTLAVAIAGLAVACNNDDGGTKPSEDEDQQQEESEEPADDDKEQEDDQDDDVDKDDPYYEETLDASDDEVEIDPENNVFSADLPDYEGDGTVLIYHTIGGIPDDLDMVQEKMNEYTKEHMNVTVDFTYHGWDDYGSNMNTIINAGEAYDIAFGSSITGVDSFARDRVFADISKLLPATPNLEALIPEELWTAMTLPNGEVYGVPAYKDSAATQYWVWDKTKTDKYGIDYEGVVDMEDLTPILKDAQEQGEEYPMLLTKNGINSLLFEYEHLGGGVGVLFGETEAVNMFEQEDVQKKFRILREWYEEGLTNPDAPTVESFPDTTDELVGSAQGFPGAEVAWGQTHKEGVYTYPRLGPMYTTGTVKGSFLVVSRASQNKQDAIKYIERLNVDHYLRNMFSFGIEGEHYEMVEGKENTIEKTEAADRYSVPNYSQGQFMNLYVLDPNPADMWLQVNEMNQEAEVSELLGFNFDTSNVEDELASTENTVDKYRTALNTGSQDIDAVLDQMNEELKAGGIDTIIAEAQEQIDAFLAAKE